MRSVRGAASAVANAPTYRFLQAGIFVVLGIAFATSFSSGSSGAEILGYQPAFVSSVPLICDIVAALAMVVHGRVRDDRPMRRLAAWFVLVPMMLSWAANALDHLLRAPAQPHWSVLSQRAWIAGVVIFAGLAPVAVAGLLHFMARYVEHQQRIEAESDEKQSQESRTETVETTPETEFVEPAPRIPTLTVPPVAVETVSEVDAETVNEINEIETRVREERIQALVETWICDRRVAEIAVDNPKPNGELVSRATAYRRWQKETGDETAVST